MARKVFCHLRTRTKSATVCDWVQANYPSFAQPATDTILERTVLTRSFTLFGTQGFLPALGSLFGRYLGQLFPLISRLSRDRITVRYSDVRYSSVLVVLVTSSHRMATYSIVDSLISIMLVLRNVSSIVCRIW
jgi:hypothetical protein